MIVSFVLLGLGKALPNKFDHGKNRALSNFGPQVDTCSDIETVAPCATFFSFAFWSRFIFCKTNKKQRQASSQRSHACIAAAWFFFGLDTCPLLPHSRVGGRLTMPKFSVCFMWRGCCKATRLWMEWSAFRDAGTRQICSCTSDRRLRNLRACFLKCIREGSAPIHSSLHGWLQTRYSLQRSLDWGNQKKEVEDDLLRWCFSIFACVLRNQCLWYEPFTIPWICSSSTMISG